MLRRCGSIGQWLVVFCLLFSPVLGQVGVRRYTDERSLEGVSREKFTFAVLGDRTGSGPDSWRIFKNAISEINQLRPDFVVMVGDVIEGGSTDPAVIESQWVEAQHILDSLQVPLFLVPGNHDIWNQVSYSVWRRILGNTYTSFNYRDCHFIILNTEEIHGTGEEGFGSQQMAFIEADIAQHRRAKQIFFFLHQPVWLLSGKIKSQWERIESLIQGLKYSVFAGHLHLMGSKLLKGNRYFISGPTGGKLRLPRNPSLGIFQHYTWVTVEGDASTVGVIEPGRIYPEELALKAYNRYIQGLFLLKGKRLHPQSLEKFP
jgi:3',5'-cyclic AMP phosphodiesterase CpdA